MWHTPTYDGRHSPYRKLKPILHDCIPNYVQLIEVSFAWGHSSDAHKQMFTDLTVSTIPSVLETYFSLDCLKLYEFRRMGARCHETETLSTYIIFSSSGAVESGPVPAVDSAVVARRSTEPRDSKRRNESRSTRYQTTTANNIPKRPRRVSSGSRSEPLSRIELVT